MDRARQRKWVTIAIVHRALRSIDKLKRRPGSTGSGLKYMPVTSQGAPESVSSKLAVLGDHKDKNQYDEEKVLPLSRERQQTKETMGVKVIRYPSHHKKGTKENNSNIL